MPEFTFILPHWVYWSVLALFPLIAMWYVRRQERNPPDPYPKLFLAYLFWLCSGFAGLHRFYLRSRGGFIFVAVFVVLLYANIQVGHQRVHMSDARAADRRAVSALERAERRAERLAARESGLSPERAAELEELRGKAQGARTELGAAQAELKSARRKSSIAAGVLGALLLVDALLMPRMVRRRREYEIEFGRPEIPGTQAGEAVAVGMMLPDEEPKVRGRDFWFTRLIDNVNKYAGEYVAYWTIIAVFVYTYEVIVRYLFNSPTNWAHEGMFLMFGMLYILSGGYGYRDDSHVRVDILYSQLPPRGRAACDVFTSIFFFIFTVTLLVTSWRFAMDSFSIQEVSFTEWAIQYWVIKMMMPLGALLVVLQGVARLVRDIMLLTGHVETAPLAHGD